MDPGNEIPAHVLQFLEANIDTVSQLETLLMMFAERGRSWSVSDVASHNYITEQRATETVKALLRRGLISPEESPPLRFRFSPGKGDVCTLVADLAWCYQKKLSLITQLIHAKPSASVKEFARAFDLKKDR